jgi:hypothetical protein
MGRSKKREPKLVAAVGPSGLNQLVDANLAAAARKWTVGPNSLNLEYHATPGPVVPPFKGGHHWTESEPATESREVNVNRYKAVRFEEGSQIGRSWGEYGAGQNRARHP